MEHIAVAMRTPCQTNLADFPVKSANVTSQALGPGKLSPLLGLITSFQAEGRRLPLTHFPISITVMFTAIN